MKVAIFDAETIKALPIIRSLGRKGLDLISFSFEVLSLGASSKFVSKNYYLHNLNVKQIKKIFYKEKPDIVFPLEERTIRFFLDNTSITDGFNFILPEKNSFSIFNDKSKTIDFVTKLGVSVPKTFVPDSLESGIEYLNSRKYFPVILKPKHSSGSRGLKLANSAHDAIKKLRVSMREYGYPLIQEFIPAGGKAIGAEFLFYKGEEVLSFSHERIREFPVNGGPSTFCKISHNINAIEIGRKILKAANYTGFAMVEFKEHPLSKKLYLMEVNPRPWGSISLPIYAGVNFPVEAVMLFHNPKNYFKKEISFDKNLFMRWFFPADLLSIVFNRKYSFYKKMVEIFRVYPNTVYQVVDKTDIKPLFVMIIKMVSNLFNFEFIKKNLLRK
jgi:predicted ATP-grasp superfamily ATP-dependent carboligase